MKECARCGQIKSIEQFCKRSNRKGGLASCLECERKRKYEYAKKYRSKNREKISERDRIYNKLYPERIKKTSLKRFYGLTPDQVNEMLEFQNYKCIICGYRDNPDSKKREDRLHIDHCHKTNKIRGLLCAHCNRGLGSFYDNIKYLDAAKIYLQKHSP